MLKLRAATVVETLDTGDDRETRPAGRERSSAGAEQRLVVELTSDVDAARRREAIADVALVGRAEVGDEVVVNVEALDLDLGSGGFDVVHVNLTRGLDGENELSGGLARAMKLNYTSLQHAVTPVEREQLAAAGRATGGGAGPARPARGRGVGVRAGSSGRAARLRADRGRRAARRALAHRSRAARARPARRIT